MQDWQTFLLLLLLLSIFIGFPICWICSNTCKENKRKNQFVNQKMNLSLVDIDSGNSSGDGISVSDSFK